MKQSQSRRAFSTVEVVISVLIVGILASVAIPTYQNSIVHRQSRLAANHLANDLNKVASWARANSTSVTIHFSSSSLRNRYYYLLGDDNTQHTTKFSDSPFGTSLDETPGTITFDHFGLPDQSAKWAFQQNTRFESSVTIDHVSGKVTVQ